MRILSITFSNLNSLHGTWEIDLQYPEYSEHGIFAIVGPTGAGKTTILDAICLSLYGKTPRLEKVTTAENEIISVGAGECFASVRFQTSEGEYIAYWEQKKSRRKIDGTLQDAKHSLYLVDGSPDGKILSNKKGEIAEILSKITGISGIDQFTRSVLLAQGSFSEFLEAKEDERAKLLEKITGVEIYTDISIAAHEKSREWNEKIKQKDQEKNIQILSEEEREKQTDEQDRLMQQLNEQASYREEIEKQQAVHETVQKLKRSFDELDVEKEEINKEKEAFAQEQEILLLARKAREIEKQYTEVEESRKQVKHRDEELAGNINQKATAVERRDEIKLIAENAEQSYQKAAKEKEELEAVLVRVREFDTLIVSLEGEISGLEKEKGEKESKIQQCREKQRAFGQKQEEIECEMHSQEQWLLKHDIDRTLLSSLSGIVSGIEQRKKLIDEHGTHLNKQKELTEREKIAKISESELKKEVEKLKSDVERCTRIRDSCKAAYEQIANGLDPGMMKIDLEAAQKHQKEIEECITYLTAYKICADECVMYDAEFLTERQKLITILESLQDADDDLKAAQKRYDEFTRQHMFAGLRDELTPGEPCPLCGSADHPYALHSIGDEELFLTEKEALEAKISNCEEKEKLLREKAQTQKTVMEKASSHYEMRHKDKQARHQEAALFFSPLKTHIQLHLPEPQESVPDAEQISRIVTCIDALQALHTSSGKEIEKQNERFTLYMKQNREEKEAQTRLESVQKKFQEESTRLQSCVLEVNECIQAREQCSVQLRKISEDLLENETVLMGELRAYGYMALPEEKEELDKFVEELSKRSSRYQEITGLQSQKKGELISHLNELKVTQTNIEHIQNNLKEIDEKLITLQKNCSERVSIRKGLFGVKNPDIEQKNANTQVLTAENEKNAAHITLANISAEIQSLEKRISETEIALQNAKKVREEHEVNFAAICITHGFETETVFISARLPPDRINELEDRDEKLRARINHFSGQQRHLQVEWNKVDHMLISGTDEETLRGAHAKCSEQINVLTEEIGRIKERIHADEKAREKMQQLQSEYDSLCREASPWLDLDNLIGSSDGKVYRDFAQSLTFGVLVEYANMHLQRLTDRYQLIGAEKLSFQVRDLYQAGEIRSIKNLSGGEKFIVSLALALGLSGMAGEKICIDSLFLDEGFGTLDEQALELALDTLSTLPHEGKMIGIISHVRALKDRIPTQIVVTKVGDGRSTITGPGCRWRGS
jgi:exonuclease SbcC